MRAPRWFNAFVSLAWMRAVLVVSGRPFARALVAPTMAWLVPAAILFGGNGMTAEGAVSVFRTSLAAWAVVVLGFSLLTANAMSAAVNARGMTTLVSLRRSRWATLGPLGVIVTLGQAPLFVLFARAGLVVAGVLHVMLAICLELLLVRLRAAGHSSSTRRGPSCRALARPMRAQHPLRAMCVYYMRALWRREQAGVSLSGTAMALGAGALWLSFQNDPPRSALGRAMCVLPISLCVAAALLVRPLVREEAALRSLLRSTRTRAWVPALAMIAVVCVPNAAYASAATYGASARASVADTAGTLAFGFLVALAVVAWALRHGRTRKQDPTLFVAGTIAIAIASTTMGIVW